MLLTDVFACGDKEATRTAGWVANQVVWFRLRHLDHEANDVTRSSELAVLAGAGDLAEHVLIEVALGVSVLHRNLVNQVHDLGQKRGRWDGEPRVLHVVSKGGSVSS